MLATGDMTGLFESPAFWLLIGALLLKQAIDYQNRLNNPEQSKNIQEKQSKNIQEKPEESGFAAWSKRHNG